MTKHIVCLTFDHDNMSPFISRGMTTPTPISRGDFGIVATERLLALFEKYRIATTWFTPGHTIETYPDCARAVFAAGHEIAHHGWTHVVPATLSREEEEAELVRGNAAIKTLTGKNARGYRSPKHYRSCAASPRPSMRRTPRASLIATSSPTTCSCFATAARS